MICVQEMRETIGQLVVGHVFASRLQFVQEQFTWQGIAGLCALADDAEGVVDFIGIEAESRTMIYVH